MKEMAFLNVLIVAFTSGLFRTGVVRSLGFFFPYYQIGVYHVHEGIACGKRLHLELVLELDDFFGHNLTNSLFLFSVDVASHSLP